MSIKTIAFIGIGNMGWPMAANLVKAGFAVSVTDAVPGKADQFAAEVGGKSGHVLSGVDAVVTILPTSKQVDEVLTAMAPDLKAGHAGDRHDVRPADRHPDPGDHAGGEGDRDCRLPRLRRGAAGADGRAGDHGGRRRMPIWTGRTQC